MTEGKCPSCGAPVAFRAGAGSVVVCDSCQAVVARTDRGLRSQSQVADLVDTDSPLQVGVQGTYGKKGFRVIGRLQRFNGTSTWDEWALHFDGDGSDAWLSESEGQWRLMAESPLPAKLSKEKWTPGGRFAVVDDRVTWDHVVEEVGKAEVVSAQGELPRGFTPGVKASFLEATTRNGDIAYVEQLPGEAPVLFRGKDVRLSELGLDLSALPPPRRQVKLQDARCTGCNGPLEFRAPDLAQRVACPYCGALLDCSTRKLQMLQQLAKPSPSAIPLGKKGKLFGVEWTVLARLRRSCKVDGVRYGWHEYLLWQREAGFRWLMEANAHWTFLEPLAAGKVRLAENGKSALYDGRWFELFQDVYARTDAVMGECYWQVAEGDVTRAFEYVKPPHALNLERTEDEESWTFSTYLSPDQVVEAFSPRPMFPPDGIAPSQPNPVTEAQQRNGTWALVGAAVVLLLYGFLTWRAQEVTLFSHSFTPAGPVGSPETMFFSEPFRLDHDSKLEVRGGVQGLTNSWAAMEVDLVGEDNQVTASGLDFEYYWGVEDAETWVEARSEASEPYPQMKAGTYQVRVVPNWENGKPPPGFRVEVATVGPRLLWAFWAWVLLLAIPLVNRIRYDMFESARWADSARGERP
ncbi:MAG: DUF4178 domain-containing protein [Deltaproteobacteria bacterium]|nr:DUF4178 domain-containing protein [Deltaproteobacteria bacterium]